MAFLFIIGAFALLITLSIWVFKIEDKKFQSVSPRIELLAKIIGLIGIAVPLSLFYLQSRITEREKENNRLSEIFINASIDLNKSIYYKFNTEEFENASVNIKYKYITLLDLHCDNKISHKYNDFMKTFNILYRFKKLSFYGDSIERYYFDELRYYSFDTISWPRTFTKERLESTLHRIDESIFKYGIGISEFKDSITTFLESTSIDSTIYLAFNGLFDSNLSTISNLGLKIITLRNFINHKLKDEFIKFEKMDFNQAFENPSKTMFAKTSDFRYANDSLFGLAKQNTFEKFELFRTVITNKICESQ